MVSIQDLLEPGERVILDFESKANSGQGGLKIGLKGARYSHTYLTRKRVMSVPKSIASLLGGKTIGVFIKDIKSIRYFKYPLGFKAKAIISYMASATKFYLAIEGKRKDIDNLIEEIKKYNSKIEIEI